MCEVLQSSFLYACLCVCLLAHVKISGPDFAKFSVHVACGWGSVFFRSFNTLCTSGFVDAIMFSHNGPVSRKIKHECTTLCFVKFATAAPWAKSDVYDWLFCNNGLIYETLVFGKYSIQFCTIRCVILPVMLYRVGQKKWYRTYNVLHCTCGITFLAHHVYIGL